MEETEVKKEVKKGRGGEKQGFRKKSSGGAKFNRKQQSSNADEFFDRYCFCVGKEGPEMYVKTIEKLGLYEQVRHKNMPKEDPSGDCQATCATSGPY